MTALEKRWRQEIHIVHFSVGEATITLQDVAILFEIRIDRRHVISLVMQDMRVTCHEQLGVTPDERPHNGTLL